MKKLIELLIKIFSRGRRKPSPPRRTPTSQKPGCKVNCKPPKPAKRPVRRHDPCKTRGNDQTKERNTILDPDFDITADLEAINSGSFIREGNDYIVGDRRYGYHPDTGTLYPKSGPGMVDIDRPQHQFLKKLNSVSQKEAMKFAKNTPGLDQKKIDQVLEIWRRCK